MKILDELNKTVAGGVERVRFEARRLQKTTRIQSEIYDLQAKHDATIRQLGQQVFELYRQGQLNAPGIADLAATLQQLSDQLAVKNQDLQQAQAEVFVEPAPPPASQQVPIQVQPNEPDLPVTPPGEPVCPRCGYVGGSGALFCANCGTRVAP